MPYRHLNHMEEIMVYCYDCNWLVCINCFQMPSNIHMNHKYDMG